jgi:hypothetical protein
VPLIRNVRIKHPGVLGDLFGWFDDILADGPPGRFTYTGATLNYNSYENQIADTAAATHTFFDRTVNAGGAAPYPEPTPDVSITIDGNSAVGRLTMVRSTLGASADAAGGDMPPLATTQAGNVLPFFLGVDRPDAPIYEGRDLTIAYTEAELAASGCPEDALFVARFNHVTNAYDALPSQADAGANQVRLTGSQNADGIYGLFCPGSGVPFDGHLDARRVRLVFPQNPARPQKVSVSVSISGPSGSLALDPTTSDVDVTVFEDRNTVLFAETMTRACWSQKSANSWRFDPDTCASPGSVVRGSLRRSTDGAIATYRLALTAQGSFALETLTAGGGGTQAVVTIDGTARATTGGRCRAGGASISCTRYD